MKNKKLLLLIILAIFCIGITISSVSASDNQTNMITADEDSMLFPLEVNSFSKENIDEELLEQNMDSPVLNNNGKQSIWINDEDDFEYYKDSTTKNEHKVGVSLLTNQNKDLNLVLTNPKINYTIENSDGQIVYTNTQTGEKKDNEATACIFPSNYEIFKNLPNGEYICTLTTKNVRISGDHAGIYSGDTFKWTVNVFSNKQKTYSTNVQKTTPKKHYIKYIKVGKYKVKVWSDDSLNTQKNKVIKHLKKYVKKGHTFKIHGYKFKVSAKMYQKILYYKKYGFDGKMGLAFFKAKTNKYYTIKKPIYKTKKITKKVWKFKKVLRSEYWSWDTGSEWQDYNTWEKYTKKGWTWYGTSDKNKFYNDGSYYSAHYYKLKKKVKTTITKKTITGYKKIKVRVHVWSVESKFKVCVQFRASGKGNNQPITGYYPI